MSFDLKALKDAVAKHGIVGRIVIASHAGSAPRETGTSMLVWQQGQSGTIGGGALEFEAVNALRKRLSHGSTTVEKVPLGPALGQCCGGAVTLVNEIFTTQTLDKIDDAEPLYTRRVTGTKSAPLSVARAQAQTRSGRPAAFVFQDGWLSEPVQSAATPLWIYGAGHVGRAIVATLAPLPAFEITWIDTGPTRFPNDPPPQTTLLPTPNPATAARLAPSNALHLILTYSHALDLELCHQLLQHGFASAGLIGSATKWARFRSRLKALGHTDAQISRITCPIGDPALGKHPQAIALGVAAALVMQSRGGAAQGAEDAPGGQATA